jgi:hypothetical protein
MTKHVHADLIKAWADGAEIELLYPKSGWKSVSIPTWSVTCQYRVKPVPHKWQTEYEAWLAGKVVQLRPLSGGQWRDWQCKPPNKWVPHCSDMSSPEYEWRIKPEPVVQGVCIRWLNSPTSHAVGMETGENYAHLRNVRFTFEDGKLVKAEVI